MAYEVRKTARFNGWLSGLKDLAAKGIVAARITRIEGGLLGDYKDLGGGLTEFRVQVGPGYRLYATKQGRAVILLLCAGDKSSQKADIADARTMIGIIDAEKQTAKKAAKKATKKKKK